MAKEKRTAFQLAKDLGIVPEWKVGEGDYRGDHLKALVGMKKKLRAHLDSTKSLPVLGLRPPDHVLPDLPGDRATAEECKQFQIKQDAWLDEVYYPGEAERAVWETVHAAYADLELEHRMKWLSVRLWCERVWAPMWRIGLALAGATGVALGIAYVVGH